MDFFQHRNYRINKMLLTLSGLWPYSTTSPRRGIIAFIFFFAFTEIVPVFMAVLKYYKDWKIFVDCILPLVFCATCIVRWFTYHLNSQKMLKLLNRIKRDWQVWAGDRQVNILDNYAQQGRKLTLVYIAMYSSSGIGFIILPMIPKIINVFLKNSSEPGLFPVPVHYYHLDMQKYYFYIMLHICATASVGHLVFIACGSMFIVFVHHGCGIFAALGDKLEQIGKDKRLIAHDKTGHIRDMDFEGLVSCIDRHKDAIEFVALVEASYSWCFFFTLGLLILNTSTAAFQIINSSTKPHEVIRFTIVYLGGSMILYSETYLSQILMDHSTNLCYYILNVKWYKLSLKAQKLLPMMLMRCNVPCQLTAGKVLIMSLPTFGRTMKASFSYLTLLRSI